MPGTSRRENEGSFDPAPKRLLPKLVRLARQYKLAVKRTRPPRVYTLQCFLALVLSLEFFFPLRPVGVSHFYIFISLAEGLKKNVKKK